MDFRDKITDLVRDRRTQIPTLPVIVHNILQKAEDERSSAQDMAKIIQNDQAISNKIIKLANSAYFGLACEVDSIPRAIALIGFNDVVGLAVGMSVFDAFKFEGVEASLDMPKLWLHAIGTATAARMLAQEVAPGKEELVFLAGLLHDIGKVIFAVYFPLEYRIVVNRVAKVQKPLNRQEHLTLGLDHAELAQLLMTKWNFPDRIAIPIRHHHDTAICPPPYKRDAAIIELANFLCHATRIGQSGNHVVALNRDLLIELDLSVDQIDILIATLKIQQPEIEKFLKTIG